MSNAKKDVKKDESKNEKKKEHHLEYQQRVGQVKNAILILGERNMENTMRVIKRWLNDDTRIINQNIVEKFGKNNNIS